MSESTPFNLQGLASALPPLSPTQQSDYARLRRHVENMGHGFYGDAARHRGGKYYAVWAGRQIGIFADWPSCNASVIGYPSNGYRRYRTWDAAVDAITQYLWDTTLKQPRAEPSGTEQSLSSESSHSPSTPSKPSSSTVKSPSSPTARRATPTPTRLPPRAPTEYFVVLGKRSTSFFVEEDDAREHAFALQELEELCEFISAESLSDAVDQLKVGAKAAAQTDAERKSRR
ncbi:hypothetical protein C8F01DRAFT_1263651 [Mycena amicta]|nr:hypothetical protein C8F01DRAFT_1263651 [Mycena amicta]